LSAKTNDRLFLIFKKSVDLQPKKKKETNTLRTKETYSNIFYYILSAAFPFLGRFKPNDLHSHTLFQRSSA
jgi:hypothetical protein